MQLKVRRLAWGSNWFLEKLDPRRGARTGDSKSSDLPSGLELGILNGIGSENRGIPRAIGLSS